MAAAIESHWDATDRWWRPGVPVLTWHLVFDDHLALHDLARRVGPLLDLTWLDRVPIQWLHVTLQGIAPEPEVEPADRDRLVAEAAARCAGLEPIHLRLGPARVGTHGVALEAEPAVGLRDLRDRLQDADAATRGHDRVPDWRSPLHPHVTLAYANARSVAAALRETLAASEAETTLELTPTKVSLLRLHRAHRLYHWDVLEEVPLASPAPRPPSASPQEPSAPRTRRR